MRDYDALFIFGAALKEEEYRKGVDSVKAEAERAGGTLVEVRELGKKGFARPFRKGGHEGGYYVRFSLRMGADAIASFRERFRHREDVVRVQIVAAEPAKAAEAGEKAHGLDESSVPAGQSYAGR